MKRCSKCRASKPESRFYNCKRFPDGLTAWCKACFKRARQTPESKLRDAAAARRWYHEHRERALARTALYRQSDRGRAAAERAYSKLSGAARLFTTAKSRAKRRGIPFDLEVSDIVIPEHCPLLGIVLVRGTRKPSAASPSLDRIDPTKGYIKGNVRVISWRANRLKMDASLEELEMLVTNLRACTRAQAA